MIFRKYLESVIFLIIPSFNGYSQPPQPIFILDAASGIKTSNNKVLEWSDPVRSVKAIQTTIANQPLIIPQSTGGRPALRFNGSSTFMLMPALFPVQKDYTLIVVCKANGSSNNILGGTTHTLWMAGGTSPKILHNGDFNNQVSSSFDPGLEPVIIVAQYNNSTQNGRLILNGIYEDSSYCPRNPDSSIYISAYQGGYHFNGDISEIQLYNHYLNNTERSKLEKELKLKYAIKDPPPPDSTFTIIPENFQFFPRDENNEASLQIKGFIEKSNFDSIQFLLYREQVLVSKTIQVLNYNANLKTEFNFSAKIKAELANYAFEIILTNPTKDSLIARRENLVAGDVYIITGQSNSIFGGNPYSNSFIRTFGKNYSLNKADTKWTIASATGYGGGPDIGAWGMDLAKSIIENYKIPVCILNGGVGGTSIQQHQRNDINPALPVNIYGSLLYRAQQSNLAEAAKAIFWYQGESNNSNLYFENFKALYEDWKIDYPNVQKVYVVQIHHGCGAGDHAAVREIQRKLPETFSNIELISTMGLSGHDGCHYTLGGYLQLAKNIFPLVQIEFYNGMDQEELYPPNIKQAYYSKQDFSEITLVFQKENASLILPGDSTINGLPISLKDYFALDDVWKTIKNIQATKNKLILELKTPRLAKTVNYLPEVNYHDFNSVYQGPYLKNNNQLGALSFYKFPIEKQMPTATNHLSEIIEPVVVFFPNPGDSKTSLKMTTNYDQHLDHVEILFRNLIGEILFTKTIEHLPSGNNTITVDIQKEIDQTLIWQFKSGNFFKTGKWLNINSFK